MLIAFNKPFGVLSQFTANDSSHRALAEFGFPRQVYPLGRLDADSEGLLLLSDEGELNRELLLPARAHQREYWAQVERVPEPEALRRLEQGVALGGLEQKSPPSARPGAKTRHAIRPGFQTLPCRAWLLDPQPELPAREPPIRFRKTVPTAWIGLELLEGKNRQVRRMTAAIGHPTLRLLRVRIGGFQLGGLPPGRWKVLDAAEREAVFQPALDTGIPRGQAQRRSQIPDGNPGRD
jgi:23S rRNA pseudouridine2457 synthase